MEKRELIPTCCPLTATHTPQHCYTQTHTIAVKNTQKLWGHIGKCLLFEHTDLSIHYPETTHTYAHTCARTHTSHTLKERQRSKKKVEIFLCTVHFEKNCEDAALLPIPPLSPSLFLPWQCFPWTLIIFTNISSLVSFLLWRQGFLANPGFSWTWSVH